MQPILSPSKVSVHLSSWDISRDFHFHSNLLIYIAANNWQDYIKSFSIHGWRKILFSWPKRDIIFLLSSWDIAILFDRLHRFELGAIRFPRIFFNSNTWYWDENKAKLTNFIELAILEFWCPKRTHNTKSTLLPLYDDMRCCAIMCDDMRWRLWPSHLKILAKKTNSKVRRRIEDHQGGGKVCAQQIIGGDALREQLWRRLSGSGQPLRRDSIKGNHPGTSPPQPSTRAPDSTRASNSQNTLDWDIPIACSLCNSLAHYCSLISLIIQPSCSWRTLSRSA